jgi:hypothetical protein
MKRTFESVPINVSKRSSGSHVKWSCASVPSVFPPPNRYWVHPSGAPSKQSSAAELRFLHL